MMKTDDCRTQGVQIQGAAVFHHPRCGHVAGNRWLRKPDDEALIAMCCFGRWMEDDQ
jgi:hypothetical protein